MAEFASIGELEVFAKGFKEHLSKEIGDLKTTMQTGFKAVEDKQDHTNGRVKKLELWKSYFIGIITALNVFVYPTASYLLYTYFNSHFK